MDCPSDPIGFAESCVVTGGRDVVIEGPLDAQRQCVGVNVFGHGIYLAVTTLRSPGSLPPVPGEPADRICEPAPQHVGVVGRHQRSGSNGGCVLGGGGWQGQCIDAVIADRSFRRS